MKKKMEKCDGCGGPIRRPQDAISYKGKRYHAPLNIGPIGDAGCAPPDALRAQKKKDQEFTRIINKQIFGR